MSPCGSRADGFAAEPDVLRAQVRRMMQDPRIERFATAFPRQWLRLAKVGMFRRTKSSIQLDEHLQKSTVQETTACFRKS